MKKYRAVEYFMQSNSLHRREMGAFKGSDTSVEPRVNIQIPTNLKINHTLSEVTVTQKCFLYRFYLKSSKGKCNEDCWYLESINIKETY